MASRKEYEMLFQLSAQLNGNFNSTFSNAQKQLASMQKEIQALSKTQSNIAAYQKQQTAVENTRNKLATLQQQYDNIQKEIKETEGYSSSLENKLLSKQQQIEKTAASLKNQTARLDEMGEALKKAGVDIGNLTNASEKLSAEMDDLKQKQVEVAESAEELGSSGSEAFELIQQAIATAGVAAALKEIGEMYAECIEASMEFESAMTGVSKTTDMSDAELAQMGEEIKALATEIPITTTELANVAEVAGQLGIAKDDLLDFSTIMSMLATATTMTADEAATMLAQFANITQMDPMYYSNLASTIVDLGNNYATTEQKITDMAQGIAASASIAGMSEAEMVALSAAVTSLGIETQAGATSMSKLITEIMTAVETGDNLGMFASIAGMSSIEFQEAWGVNAVNALRAFVVGLSDTERNGMSATAALAELGITEARMQRMILSLSNSGDLLNRTLETANTAWEENTALTVEAEKRYATTESQLTMMKNSANNLEISIGDALTPAMADLYGVAGDVLDETAMFISQNPALVQSVTAFVGVLSVATTGMLAYASAKKVVKALGLGSLFTSPYMWEIAGVAALTAGVVGLVKAHEEAEIAARRYGAEVSEAASEYKEAMGQADELEQNINNWRTLNETISSGTASADEVTADKERLKETEQWLIDNYGIYMNNDGTISQEEIDSLEKRNEELRETARLKAEIALYNAKESYDTAKGEIGDTQEKRDALQAEISQMVNEQEVLSKHYTSWQHTMESDEYKNANASQQSLMFNEALGALHNDLNAIGVDDDYSGQGFAGIAMAMTELEGDIDSYQKELNDYNTELLEYQESAIALKNATRDVIDQNIDNISTDNLAEFAAIAKSIGEQAANAELEASELEAYAAELTEVAHAAGLLPENQQIAFNADGALNVIEEVEDGVDELDGKTAEITATADAESAEIKIDNVLYKVLEYDDITGVATLSADGKTAFGQINLATGEVRRFDAAEASAYLNANTDDLDTNIDNAKLKLSGLDGKTVTVTTIFKSVYQTVKQALGFGDGYASGTDSATPGWHLVGELGPEFVYFGGGETVYTAAETRRMLAGATENMSVANNYQNRVEPLSVQGTASSQYTITIAPKFVVEGGGTADVDNRLQEFSDIVVANVMDALQEAGIDSKRGAYA